MAGDKKIKIRTEIEQRYKWDIESMYAVDDVWETDFSTAREDAAKYASYSGHLADSPETLYLALKDRDAIWLKAERIYVYARMRKDEDNTNGKYQAMCDRAHSLMAETAAALSFFTPELLEISDDRMSQLMAGDARLEVYRHYISDIVRQKAHILSKNEENLMAQMSELTSATNTIFGMINNADMKFGNIKDEEGEEVELTHGRYIGFMESADRRVRKDAFEAMYAAFDRQRNTLAATYNYNTKTDAVNARIRKYGSALLSSLDSDLIPQAVYDNLISAVNERLPLLHRYVEIRRRMLGLDEVHMYDLYTPLVRDPFGKITYEEALDMVRRGLAPLGEDYIDNMDRGLSSGWIDVYENKGKTSGAYSFGSYDSKPFILLNHQDKLKDVFTIAHEMGHSMHSYYTRAAQPFIYGGHSIFTAEVASTVNECLLMHQLIGDAAEKERKLYLLNMYIEEFRTTVFRQTMFAEFEKLSHAHVESGGVLTPEWLCNEYEALNRKYFGDRVAYDSQISLEWARIPHFYNAFYVYKYATGYSAAVALSEKLIKGGAAARKDYIEFLKSGEKDYPIELLKGAGVDMSGPEPVLQAMDTFEKLIVELEEII